MTQRIKVNNDQYSLLFETGKVAFPVDTKYQIIGDLTISTTIKNNVSSGTRVIALPYAGGESELNNVPWLLRIVSQNRLEAFHEYGAGANSSTTTVTTKVPTGKYVHITVVRDSVALLWKFYINGALKESIAYTNNASGGSTTALQVGCDTFVGTDYFKGNIKNLGIFNRCLSQEEITNLFFNKIVPTDFVEFFDFSEGTGETTTGKNGTVGTISGATWSDDVPNPPRTSATNRVSTENMITSLELNSTSSDYVRFDVEGANNSQGFTLSAYVKFKSITTIGSTPRIIGIFDDSIRLFYRPSSKKIEIKIGSMTRSYANVGDSIFGRWNMVTAVFDPINKFSAIYVNGVLFDKVNNIGTELTLDGLWEVSSYENGMLGNINNVRVWNRVLQENEISQMYFNANINNDDLFSEFLFNEISGSVAINSADRSHDGTIYGSKYSLDTFKKERRNVGSSINIIAHRGFSSERPENTIAAFNNAISKNALVLETDLQVSSDGHIVLIHDSTVDRTTDGTGSVASKTLSELRLLDAGSKFSLLYAGEKIPTFQEYIDLAISNQNIHLYPEIKGYRTSDDINIMVQQIITNNIENRTTFQSFKFSDLIIVRSISQSVRISYLCDSYSEVESAIPLALSDGNADIAVYYEIINQNRELINTLKSLGIPLVVWTPSTKLLVESLYRLGINNLMSNYSGSYLGIKTTLPVRGNV